MDATKVTGISAEKYPETRKVYRVRLAYQGCAKALDSGNDLKFSVTDANGTTDYTPNAVSRSEFEKWYRTELLIRLQTAFITYTIRVK